MTSVVNSNGLSPSHTTYVSLNDDVIPWVQAISQSQIGPVQTKNLQLIMDAACSWCAEFLQKPIGPEQFDRRFNGWASWNGAYIILPKYPVLSIQSVIEYWGTGGPHVLSESTPTILIDGWQCEYNTGLLTRVFPGNVQKPWFPGSRNVEVKWTAGMNPIPPQIKIATLELIAHWYRNTQQQSQRFGGAITPASEYSPTSNVPGTMWGGIPYRVEAMLEPFISYGMG